MIDQVHGLGDDALHVPAVIEEDGHAAALRGACDALRHLGQGDRLDGQGCDVSLHDPQDGLFCERRVRFRESKGGEDELTGDEYAVIIEEGLVIQRAAIDDAPLIMCGAGACQPDPVEHG